MKNIKGFKEYNERALSKLNPISNYKKLRKQGKEIEKQISDLEKEVEELRKKRKEVDDIEFKLKDNPKHKWKETMSKS